MAHQSARGEEESLKRRKLSSRKLCAISKYIEPTAQEFDVDVLIGILDLGSDVDRFETEIRFPGASERTAFWALGSTLYVFEGWDRNCRKQEGNLVYTIDLETLGFQRGEVTLERNMLRRARPLLYSKFHPSAIRAPGNKIMVFSLFSDWGSPIGRFEIYDPEGVESRVLPPLDTGDLWIESYGFISESKFLVQTFRDGHILDLNSIGKGWKGITERVPMMSGGAFYVIEDRFCFTSDSVFDLGHIFGLGCRHWYELKVHIGVAAIGLMYDEKEEEEDCNFCICRTGVIKEKGEKYDVITIIQCRTLLKEYKKNLEEKAAKDGAVAAEDELMEEKAAKDDDDAVAAAEDEDDGLSGYEEEEEEEFSIEPITTEVNNTIEFKLDPEKYSSLTISYVFIF